MDDRLSKRRTELKIRSYRARLNYLALGAMTLANLLLMGLRVFFPDLGFQLPFFFSIPYFGVYVVKDLGAAGAEHFGQVMLWGILTVAFTVIYFLLWRGFRRKPRYYRMATGLILCDMLVGVLLVFLMQLSEFAFITLLNVAFHLYVAIYVSMGTKAEMSLSILPTEEEVEASANEDPYAEFCAHSETDLSEDELSSDNKEQ